MSPRLAGTERIVRVETVACSTFNDVSQGILTTAPDGLILRANDAFCKTTRYSAEELRGRNCSLLRGPLTDGGLASAIQACIAFCGEVLHYRKNGEAFWNDLTIVPIRDPEGQLKEYLWISRDITARRRAESLHRASQQRYQQLVENVPAAVVVHGPHSEILVANSTASEILGLSIGQMKGLVAIDPCWRFLRENGTEMPFEEYPVNRVLNGRNVIKDVVLGVRRPELAEPVWVMCNGFPVIADDGQVMEAVISFTDVTVLKRAQQALQKSEERLRLVLQGTSDAPWDWDLAAGSIYYSPRWWQMVGYAIDELPPTPELWEHLMHPEDAVRVKQVFAAALAGESATYQVEVRFRHKAGHYVPVMSNGFILRDSHGTPLRVSGINADLTERKCTEERIHRLANYDALTDLPNRRLLMDHLRQVLINGGRSGQFGALLFIDLDNFKALNDTLGHHVGDLLLSQVAHRLRGTVRASDTVGRLGDDEFLVVLEELGPVEADAAMAAEVVAQKVLFKLGDRYILGESEQRSTPSIGVALFGPASQSAEDILKQADLAMYQAKAIGRNTLRFFDASMQAAVDERVALERDMRSSLELGDFMLHYQIQVTGNGCVTGAEALVRWRHPRRGLVPPNAFIPMAEATGLILPLGAWVLRSACERLAAWGRLPGLSELTLAVNVSEQQFRQPDFVDHVLQIIDQTGASPTRLKLELTESLLAQDIEDISSKMMALREHGIHFALDDFGTGYSSLSYLKRLPLAQLKIDQSFVQEILTSPNDAMIARTIVALADSLGLTVIAEGVETADQRQFLVENGCNHFQGYYFGRPADAEVLERRVLLQSGSMTPN